LKIEVLYVAECPAYPAAVKLVREALGAGGIAAEIEEVLVSDERMATELKFVGSPSIRIDGQDVIAERQEAQSFALSCRLYAGSKENGLPTAESLRRAIIEAHRRPRVHR
jgi:hypothetical protein